MSQRLKEHSNIFKHLYSLNHVRRNKWIKRHLDKDLILYVCECIKNLLKGNIPITQEKKKELAKNRKELRQLADEKVPIKQKKKIIQQGGFLTSMLGPIVSVLRSLFGENNQN